MVKLVISTLLALALALALGACGGSGSANAGRLRVLETDPVLHCQVAGLTPWRVTSSTSRASGSNNSVPLTVTRAYRLAGAQPGAAFEALTACARQAGWKVQQLGQGTTRESTLQATKDFSGNWAGALVIDVNANSNPDQAAVFLQLEVATA